jgi:hypothetical protein
MKNQDKIDNLVLEYIYGNMEDAEKTEFESQLISNPILQEAYNLYSKTDNLLKDNEIRVSVLTTNWNVVPT